MGNIAVGIATQAAIANANKEINGMLHPSDPTIVTAPSSYQSFYQEIFYSKYPDLSDTIIAYSPALSLAQQQYTAAKSVFAFCTSYSYMNAGLQYIGTTTTGKVTANCPSFGSLYLPTFATFQDAVSSFVAGTNSTITSPPTAVDQLNKRIEGFAEEIQNDPTAVGQTRQQVTTPVKTFSIEFSFGANSSSVNYYGDLESGKFRFTLSPSSNLMFQSTRPFGIEFANPIVINVQSYWRGVTSSSGRFVTTTITPASPYMLYPDDSGVGTPYNLPAYKSGSGDLAFATFESIQVQNGCASTGETLISGSDQPKWIDGNNVDFCTPYSNSLKQPFSGISEYAFLFPLAYAQWEIETNYDVWGNNPNFAVDNETLALQVVFQYIASTTSNPIDGGSQNCMFNCFPDWIAVPGVTNSTPLPNAQWCDESNCNDCLAYQSLNGTQFTTEPFCLCNVWNGNYETCTPNVTSSTTFSVTMTTSSSARRNLRKKQAAKSEKDDETGTKSGKSMSVEEMVMATDLEGVLETYLACGGERNLPSLAQKVVNVDGCNKKKGKMTCLFHMDSIVIDDGTADNPGAETVADDCIEDTLQDAVVMQNILAEMQICEIIVSREAHSGKHEEVSHHESVECDKNNKSEMFERT